MSMNDSEIKATLKAILFKAHKRKNRQVGATAVSAVLGMLLFGGLAYDLSRNIFGTGLSLVFAFVGVVPAFALANFAETHLNRRRGHRLAAALRDAFPKETGDYDKALVTLKSAKTEWGVEKDVLAVLDPKALEAEVVIQSAVSKASPAVGSDGLFGDFGSGGSKGEPGKKAGKRPDFIPLDPFESGGRDD